MIMHGKFYAKLTAMLLMALPVNSSDLRADATSTAAAGAVSPASAVYRALAPNIEMRGRWFGGPSYTSVVSGDYVYYGAGGAIRVLKIDTATPRDASSWKEVASIRTPGIVRGLDATESHLYVADDSGALRIIDITAPENPSETGHVVLPENVKAVSVSLTPQTRWRWGTTTRREAPVAFKSQDRTRMSGTSNG
jgi:hypothetical protein